MSTEKSKILYYSSLIKNKQISCKELTESYLREIENTNKKLNAYVNVTHEEALKTASIVDRKIMAGEDCSVLEGIPMTLKDNIVTKGIETTCCSNILKGYKPIYDATVWSILKSQNAVLLGKTNMDEFAMGSTCGNSCFGGALNPHDINRVSGGSSGGVASALAANLAVYGLGSDTGGSIRQPSAFCGTVGLKPTYGAFSRYGLVAFASSFDQIGPMTSSVEDTAILFDALAKKDARDSTSIGWQADSVLNSLKNDISSLTIGVATNYLSNSDTDIQNSIQNVIEVYKSLGVKIIELDMSFLEYALPTYFVLACAEASSNLGRFDGIRFGNTKDTEISTNAKNTAAFFRGKGFGNEVKRRILLGTYVLKDNNFDEYYKKALRLRTKIIQTFSQAFDKCDLILTPTVPTTSFKVGEENNNARTSFSDICTVPANMAGLPAISVPCGINDKGLPIGLQLIGDRFSESTLLNAAWKIENALSLDLHTDWGVQL